MEKYVYEGTDITNIINEKEKRIIKLYAKENRISPEWAKNIYMRSTLKRAIRDVNNGLWMQSEYYIMEAYAYYLDTVKSEDAKKAASPEKVKMRYKANRNPAPAKVKKSMESTHELFVKTEHEIEAGKRNSKNKKNKVGTAMSQSTSGTKVKRQKKEIEMTTKK